MIFFFFYSGNTLEKSLNKIGREDIVKKCIFNVELVTDDVEKAVARVRLDQPGFDTLKDELGPSRNTSLKRDATMDPKLDSEYDEPDQMKVKIQISMYCANTEERYIIKRRLNNRVIEKKSRISLIR